MIKRYFLLAYLVYAPAACAMDSEKVAEKESSFIPGTADSPLPEAILKPAAQKPLSAAVKAAMAARRRPNGKSRKHETKASIADQRSVIIEQIFTFAAHGKYHEIGQYLQEMTDLIYEQRGKKTRETVLEKLTRSLSELIVNDMDSLRAMEYEGHFRRWLGYVDPQSALAESIKTIVQLEPKTKARLMSLFEECMLNNAKRVSDKPADAEAKREARRNLTHSFDDEPKDSGFAQALEQGRKAKEEARKKAEAARAELLEAEAKKNILEEVRIRAEAEEKKRLEALDKKRTENIQKMDRLLGKIKADEEEELRRIESAKRETAAKQAEFNQFLQKAKEEKAKLKAEQAAARYLAQIEEEMRLEAEAKKKVEEEENRKKAQAEEALKQRRAENQRRLQALRAERDAARKKAEEEAARSAEEARLKGEQEAQKLAQAQEAAREAEAKKKAEQEEALNKRKADIARRLKALREADAARKAQEEVKK